MFEYFFGAFCMGVAAFFIFFGVRVWRNVGRPLSYYMRKSYLAPELRAAYDRAALTIGLTFGLLGILAFDVAAAGPNSRRPPPVVKWIGGVGLVCMVTLGFLMASIFWINRPPFLVPPHLRDDPGIRPAGRRKRLERREPLRQSRSDLRVWIL